MMLFVDCIIATNAEKIPMVQKIFLFIFVLL